jgi:hypothetical protein
MDKKSLHCFIEMLCCAVASAAVDISDPLSSKPSGE